MQYHIQTLVKHLFEKDSFEQVTVQELKQFTEAYPYAAVGQYLYAKKLYDARSWNYYEQTEQASLYFHNPLWYRWLMDQKHETPVVPQRQEEMAQQNGYRDRVIVQMPKGGSSPVTNMPTEEVKEPVEETVAAEDQIATTGESETIQLTGVTQEQLTDWKDIDDMPIHSASVETEEAATHSQEYLPEINTQETIQADTEAFGFVQSDGTPPAEYTETVTENTTEQQQPVQEESAGETPVYTEEHELTMHEFQPGANAEPIQADTESFGDIQEQDNTETYTETVTHNTEEGYQAYTEEPAPAIENIAGIPAAKEETEVTPEFFAEVAAEQSAAEPVQEETIPASAVAIAESSLLAEEQHITGSGELSDTVEAPAAYEAPETTEAPAVYEAPETTEAVAAYEIPETTEASVETIEPPVATETAAFTAETAETPVASEPEQEQVQETQEVTEYTGQPVTAEPEAAYHDDEVQPGGDLPPYQLLDTTTEIPATEAEATAENREQEPTTGEPVHETSEPDHEGPVTIEFVQDEPVQEEAVIEHQEPVQQEQAVAEEPVVTEMTAPEEHVVEPAIQEHEPVQQEPIAEEPVNNEPVQEEAFTEPIALSTSAADLVPHETSAVAQDLPETQPEPETQEQEPELVTPEPVQWKAEPVFTPANTEPKIAINTEEPIFESYHTIDYFASQGIKLGQEDYKDRLGKQLKSFTEWLRSMKRIVPTEATTSIDDVTSRSIQRIAEHSVEEKEVITEAMAEVWAKQGHPEKAISVYEKLSLLNPAKSPYFAGRIEQLKAL